MQRYLPSEQINNPIIHAYTPVVLYASKLLFWGSVMLIGVILSLFVAVLLQQKDQNDTYMDKQKVRPLDEERESRSLLSNVVVILHLILGTLPILLVVWAVDKLMNSTLSPIIVWGIGGIMILFAMLRGVFYGTSIWRAHRSAYNALHD